MNPRAASAATDAGEPDGIPKALRGKLARLGVAGLSDLVLHLPLRYEDETRLTPLRDLLPGQTAQAEATVLESHVAYRPRRQLVCVVEDGGTQLVLRFINFYPSQVKQLAPGVRLRLFGEVRGGFLGLEMVHPRYRVVRAGTPLPESLTPVYPTTAGLAQHALRPLVQRALREADLTDTLPEPLLQRLKLPGFAPSLDVLHNPPPDASAQALEERSHPAWRRIKFDELLAQQLSMRAHRRERRSRGAPPLPPLGTLSGALLAALPFALTAAQRRVVDEIARDLARPHPMMRLLQGDVGSGKTVVAALACAQALENGYQVAVMAPTEILAEQLWRKLDSWLAPLGVTVAWLAGGQKRGERRKAIEAAADGSAQVVVGTHALVQDKLAFARLGLAVVDEQHRFGVHQRLALRLKGAGGAQSGLLPHQLMMSATPIPRTLAMSFYADLDVSLIDELPPGRSPVRTFLVADGRRDEVIARVREACRSGAQVYWVCPLVEESEALQLQTAVETFERLSAELPELQVGLLHGRLPAAEKGQVMESVKAGEVQVLVATTVIEVGVDVPNATLMVIEHAERFGLAQLHQLRGRVGRGEAASACILLYQGPLSENARARLKVIHASADGFEIARQDLRIRGPGELLGARQSGVPMLRFADLERDADLLETAREAAERMLAETPEAAARHVERWLKGRQAYLKA